MRGWWTGMACSAEAAATLQPLECGQTQAALARPCAPKFCAQPDGIGISAPQHKHTMGAKAHCIMHPMPRDSMHSLSSAQWRIAIHEG